LQWSQEHPESASLTHRDEPENIVDEAGNIFPAKEKEESKLQVILRKADFQNKQGLRFLGKKYSSKHSRE